jgi:tRNA-specific 2-thiouridylase
MNFRDIFAEKVINDFCEEYSWGRTPNPCIRCNQYIKFDALLEKARELGSDLIATGHHARIEKDKAAGIFHLKKGVDHNKDQSYFLYTLAQEQMRHSLLPVGNFTKSKIRNMAAELGLTVAAKPGSQDICFIPDGSYADFLKDRIPGAIEPGPIADESGNILGRHRGILFYTIGQRKGLGLSAREPLYVTAINPETNTVVVGSKDTAYGSGLTASELNWIIPRKIGKPFKVKARIRYRQPEVEVTVTPLEEDRVYVKFVEPQLAITLGQAVVFYDGDSVVGGGTIETTGKATINKKKSASREMVKCPS